MVMCLLQLCHIMLSFLFKCENKLSYPRSLLFPAARENVDFKSQAKHQKMEIPSFYSLFFGLCCVFSRLCVAATEARTSCALHLNQAL